MAEVSLYDILKVNEDCDRKEIKNAYRKLAKIWHPDRPNGDKEMFKLITEAFEILENPQIREKYDKMSRLKSKRAGHEQLRKEALDFIEIQTGEETLTAQERKELFAKTWAEVDEKRKVNKYDDKPITENETNERLIDLENARKQDEIEYAAKNIFEGRTFDKSLFNAAFEYQKKKMEDTNNGKLIKQMNPIAYNDDLPTGDFTEDVSVDPGLYYEDGDDNKFDKDFLDITNIDKINLDDLNTDNVYDSHNNIEDNYEEILKQRMAERDIQTKEFDDRKMDDFNTDPACDGFGIYAPLGIEFGDDKIFNASENLAEKYQLLLNERKLN